MKSCIKYIYYICRQGSITTYGQSKYEQERKDSEEKEIKKENEKTNN